MLLLVTEVFPLVLTKHFAQITWHKKNYIPLKFILSCASVASACFAASPYASEIRLILGSAEESMKKLLNDGEKFDIVFLDADKENYIKYYEVTRLVIA